MVGFVRVKRILGQKYAYAVENSWTEKGPRQKVTGYLGKVYRPERQSEKNLKEYLGIEDFEKYLDENSYERIVRDSIKLELENHGIGAQFYVNVDEDRYKNNKRKNIAFELNSGFLCNHTVSKLLEYKNNNDYSGFLLADLITACGLKLEKEVFVALYGKTIKQPKTPKSLDFYY